MISAKEHRKYGAKEVKKTTIFNSYFVLDSIIFAGELNGSFTGFLELPCETGYNDWLELQWNTEEKSNFE